MSSHSGHRWVLAEREGTLGDCYALRRSLGYGKADYVCQCIPAVTAQQLQCDEN